jgi:Gti1/Pac2 family transcription factor
MRRWTDGKSWSASRVSGSFLTYREMEGKRGGTSYSNGQGSSQGQRTEKAPDGFGEDAADGEEGPDGYRYKPDGLMKQSFSITTSTGQHLHLISYYSRSHPTGSILRQPSTDPNLANITPAKGMYPESTINDQSTVPAVTRSPMAGAPGYVVSPGAPGYHRPGPASPQAYAHPQGYPMPQAYFYPISPMHTPPPGHYLHPYAMPPGLPPLAYSAAPYPTHHPMPLSHAPPSSYDQRPLRNSESRSSVPPPPPNAFSTAQAPPGYLTASAPPPPLTHSQTAPAEPTNDPHRSSIPQIDPRLTGSSNGQGNESQQPLKQQNGTSHEKPSETATATTEQPSDTITVSASHAPNINALVNTLKTNIPPAEKGDSEADRQGSTSPGGTKNGAPPQDIPSEKLGFREDKRALSKLDRVFAKV